MLTHANPTSLPVTPEAVGQLDEGERQVEAEEEEEIPGGFVGED